MKRGLVLAFALLLTVAAFKWAWELGGMLAGDVATAREAPR